MKSQNWEYAYHEPVWITAPVKINATGDTRPGYLCIHYLENGKGICGSNVFDLEEAIGDHACVVRLRGRWNISRPCYNKYHRCPGWAGGGWKRAKHQLCDGGSLIRVIQYNERWWKWKIHRCPKCSVVVLPYMIRYTSPRQWWYSVEGVLTR